MIDTQKVSDGKELRNTIDTLLSDKLITENDCNDIRNALDDYLFDMNRTQHKTAKITCAGIYNSGKSSVLNALTDSEHFKVGDVPTTATIDEFEHNGFVYVDTPGLNANNFDNETAQKAFKDADVILFVTNMLNGGLSAAEADFLKQLAEILGGTENLKAQTIFAMSNLHQISDDSVEMIISEHSQNIESTLGFKPEKILTFDSITYENGKTSGNDQLIIASGIKSLISEIAAVVNIVSEQSKEIVQNRISAKKNVLESMINGVISPLENKVAKLTEQAKARTIDKEAAKIAIEKCREAVTKKESSITLPYIYDTYTIAGYELHRGDTWVHNAKSEFSCKNQAMSILKSAYDNRESQLNKYASSFAKHIVSVVNNYDKYRNDKIKLATDAVIECNSFLKEIGIIVPTSLLRPIDIPLQVNQIDVYDVMREFKDDVIQYSGYYSVSKYFSMYCDIDDQEYFDHTTLFGKDVYEHKYSCSCSEAIRNMADDMNETIKSNAQSIIATVNSRFKPFCDKLISELDSRLNAIISEAESIAKSAGSDINAEIEKLQNAVNSVKKYII